MEGYGLLKNKTQKNKDEELPDIADGRSDREQLQNADQNACTGQTGGQSQLQSSRRREGALDTPVLNILALALSGKADKKQKLEKTDCKLSPNTFVVKKMLSHCKNNKHLFCFNDV